MSTRIKVFVTQTAEDNFRACVDYVERVLCQHRAALDMADEFETFLQNVELMPEMYPVMQDERLREKSLRRALVGNYVVVYRFEGNVVTVLGFFHQTQDYARFF